MRSLLDALTPRTGSTALLLGYSGGGDSSALLHALASLPAIRERGLRAIHVNHGMHAQSSTWAEHCRQVCAALDVPLVVCKVDVVMDAGDGPEFAARKARFAAYAKVLTEGETLVLAHHADDQIETVLLKLLRGAGPHGLAGMREKRAFNGGWLWRPWLGFSRDELGDFARSRNIEHIEDPANADANLARSYLRKELMPRLQKHWPQARQSIQHSASLCAAASDYIEQQVPDILARLSADKPGTLAAQAWTDLADALRGPTLERWLRRLDLPAPSSAQRGELEQQIRHAASDRIPRIAWPGCEIHVWRGRMHARQPRPKPAPNWAAHWNGEMLPLPAGGTLTLTSERGVIKPALQVRLRRGGERLRPAGDSHTRALRDLFQHAGLEPWLRFACPLIYADEELIAVADLYVSDAGEALFTRIGARPQWSRD